MSILSCSVKEEEHCSGSVVAHSKNFHEVRRCVEAGPNPPHICEPWHQINGAYCRDVLAAETGDTAVTGEFFIFRQDCSPPARWSRYCNERLSITAPNLWSPTELYTGRVDPRVGSCRVGSKYSATLAGRVGSGRQFQNTKKLKCNMLYDRLMVALLFIPHSDKCNLDE